MTRLSTDDVVRVAGGRVVGPGAVARTLIADSRHAGPGTAFAAVATGHAFVEAALHAGSAFAIVEHDVAPNTGTVVIVDDVVRALMALARDSREWSDVPAVAITGSTGKTLTKDFLAAALGTSFRVHATPKSYNAELGVPLTLFGAPDDVQILVLELAARHVGEIAELCEIARPSMGVITGIGSSHIEEFGSREAIARTKSELVASLPSDGTAYLPSGDDFLDVMSASTAARVVTVGAGGAVRYRADRIDNEGRTIGWVHVGGRTVPVTLPVAGRALFRNAAFAMAVAVDLGVAPDAAAAAIESSTPSAWRMELRRTGDMTVINDAYNASPTSVASALRSAREIADGRPLWAVLGRMAELGGQTEIAHRRAGELAASLGFDGVIVVGEGASGIADGAGALAVPVGSLAEAAAAIREQVPSDAVIVIKASRVAGLERLVQYLPAQMR